MSPTTARLLAFALPLLLAAGAQGQSIEQCSRIEADAERLACFDALARSGSTGAEAEPDEIIRPTEATSEPAAAPAAANAPRSPSRDAEQPRDEPRGQFGLPAKPERTKKAEPATLTATVQEARKSPIGQLVITLDNDQVWQQTDDNRLTLRPGDEVSIREGFGGAYYLVKGTGSRSIKVKRLR